MELDRTDRALVVALMENARLSNKELAARAGIAPSTCTERLRRLEERGVIRAYRAEVDPAARGIGLEAVLAIRLRRHGADAVSLFREHALDRPEVSEVLHVSGQDDFLVRVAVRDVDHLRQLVTDAFSSWPEVAHIQTSLVFERTSNPVALMES